MSENPYEIEDIVAFVQEGDFISLKNAIVGGACSSRSTDADGCSLLHWAAINNRVQIAQYLIKCGAESNPGGILGETPLHWAFRKKYYGMAQLLHEHLHLDLAVKSKQGLDALSLTIRLGDMNGAFLLLSWGANPNTEDNNGICSLLWLIQNNNTSKGFEMIKLLIQFGANVTCTEPRSKNTLLHFLAQGKKFDLIQAFYLYHNNPPFFQQVTNAAGQGVYKLATVSENRKMAKFLLDAMLFHGLPTWFPTLIVTLLWLLLYLLLQRQGYIYGVLSWLCFATLVTWSLLQHYIAEHRDRLFIGCYMGFASILSVTFYAYIADIVSVWTRLFVITLFCVTCYVAASFKKTRPQVAPREVQRDLAQKIVDSAPSEGNDEETQELLQQSTLSLSSSTVSSAHGPAVGRVAVVKDAFTGRVSVTRQRIVTSDDLASSSTSTGSLGVTETVIRVRALGPRICGHCLSDKRCVETMTLTPQQRRQRQQSNSGSHGNNNTVTRIAIATHCPYCNLCVLDQDHHCAYLGNCVGRGNRRLFLLFHLCIVALATSYFFSSRFVVFDALCENIARLHRTEWLGYYLHTSACLWMQHPAVAFAQLLSLALSVYSMTLVYLQGVLISRETTLNMLIKEKVPLSTQARRAEAFFTLWRFLLSGEYTVIYPRDTQLNKAPSNPANSNKQQVRSKETTTTAGMRSMLRALSATSKGGNSNSSAKSEVNGNDVSSPLHTSKSALKNSSVSGSGQNPEQSNNSGNPVSRLFRRLESSEDESKDSESVPLLRFSAEEEQLHEQQQRHGHQQGRHSRDRRPSFTTEAPSGIIKGPTITNPNSSSSSSSKRVTFSTHNSYHNLNHQAPAVAASVPVVTHAPSSSPVVSPTPREDIEALLLTGDEDDDEGDGDSTAFFDLDDDDVYDDEFAASDFNAYGNDDEVDTVGESEFDDEVEGDDTAGDIEEQSQLSNRRNRFTGDGKRDGVEGVEHFHAQHWQR